MLKYYAILILIMGAVLYYIFLQDPCNENMRTDFAGKYPDYEILDSDSVEGSATSVNCRIYYKKPGDEQVFQDVWLYLNSEDGWKFSKILETDKLVTR